MLDRLIDRIADRVAEKLTARNPGTVVERFETHVHYPPPEPVSIGTWPPHGWPDGTIIC